MKNGQSLALALVRMLEKLHLSANQTLCSAVEDAVRVCQSSDLSLLKQHFKPHTFTITPTP